MWRRLGCAWFWYATGMRQWLPMMTRGNWLGFDPPLIWHSNKIRTRETADIVVEIAGWSSKPIETQGLRPSSPVEEAAIQIEAEDTDLVIVGHMPFMSGLASHLVSGPGTTSYWEFATCGTLILERSGRGQWVVLAFTSPALIGIWSVNSNIRLTYKRSAVPVYSISRKYAIVNVSVTM